MFCRWKKIVCKYDNFVDISYYLMREVLKSWWAYYKLIYYRRRYFILYNFCLSCFWQLIWSYENTNKDVMKHISGAKHRAKVIYHRKIKQQFWRDPSSIGNSVNRRTEGSEHFIAHCTGYYVDDCWTIYYYPSLQSILLDT